MVDPCSDEGDVAAVPPSIPTDPDNLSDLTADEALALRHIMDRAQEKAKQQQQPVVKVSGSFLDTLEDELACRFGMRGKACLDCND